MSRFTATELAEHLSGSDNDYDDALGAYPGIRLTEQSDEHAVLQVDLETADTGRETARFRVTIDRVEDEAGR